MNEESENPKNEWKKKSCFLKRLTFFFGTVAGGYVGKCLLV